MNYNVKESGKRIKELRKAKGYTVNTDELVHTARSSSACFPVFQCTLSAAQCMYMDCPIMKMAHMRVTIIYRRFDNYG